MSSDLYIDTARILIIEESAVLRQLALNSVEELGLIAQTCSDLMQAAQKLDEKEFDLVLIEAKSPEKTAIANLEALRRLVASKSSKSPNSPASSKGSKKVPIVVMASGVKREPLLAAGANDILMRPFMLGELEAVIDRWLSPGAIV